jgi:hypothetical protein
MNDEVRLKTIPELAADMAEVKAKYDEHKQIAGAYWHAYEEIRKTLLVAALEDAGMDKVRVPNVGTVTLTGDVYASIPSENKGQAFEWLIEKGYGDIITQTVNASTLKALVKEQMKQGVQFPDLFRIEPYTYAKLGK